MKNLFKKLFKTKVVKKPIPSKEINLSNIKQSDDVWLKIDGKIFEGWVVEKVFNILYISYTNEFNKLEDAEFTIERPLDRTFIEQEGQTLYLVKPSS